MFDMIKMLGKLNDFKSKMEQVKNSLPSITASLHSENNQIQVIAQANHQLASITLDADMLKNETVQDIEKKILATVNKALREAAEKGNQEIKTQTQGLLPNIPGVDLGSLLAR